MATRVQLFSDNMNRATLGSDWENLANSNIVTTGSSAFVASHFGAVGSTYGLARYVGSEAASVTADQFVVVSLAALTDQGAGHGVGGALRVSADTDPNCDCYYFWCDSDAGSGGTHTLRIARVLNGTQADIVTTTSVVSNADTIEGEAEGTALRLYVSGVLKLSTTDGNLASGSIGIINASNAGAGNHGDSVLGGNLTASATARRLSLLGAG